MCALFALNNEFEPRTNYDYDNNDNGNDGIVVAPVVDIGNVPAGKSKGRVLRFEFAGMLIEQVTAFANVHQYDDRKTYKEAWTTWLAHDEIAALLKTEVERLSALGYKGDVADKLFKSGRYYFRGKTNADDNKRNKCSAEARTEAHTEERVKERKYVLMNRQLLNDMDEQIDCGLRSAEYTPASGFADFCKTNAQSDIYCSEVARLSELMHTGDAVYDKLKKTYKNRYFMMTKAAATKAVDAATKQNAEICAKK